MLSITLVLDEPAWPDLDKEKIIHITTPIQIAALTGGMTSGAPSVALRLELPDGDGRVVIAETSLRLLVAVTRALVARYGDPLQTGPA